VTPVVSPLRVRLARPDEVERVTDFNLRLARESEALDLDPSVVRRGVEALFAHPDRGFYLLAETSASVIGQLLITREWSDWRCAFFWWLQSVYVAPDHRRRGVLRALVDHVVEMARQEGDVCGLRLYAHHGNENALRVYLRLGMRPLDYRMIGFDLDD
jgi:GNAT superfamily N-acetyltransferase